MDKDIKEAEREIGDKFLAYLRELQQRILKEARDNAAANSSS